MSEDPTGVLADIDRTATDLGDLIEGLRTEGAITDDDAEEFAHRTEMLGAELRTCVEYATDGPLNGGRR